MSAAGCQVQGNGTYAGLISLMVAGVLVASLIANSLAHQCQVMLAAIIVLQIHEYGYMWTWPNLIQARLGNRMHQLSMASIEDLFDPPLVSFVYVHTLYRHRASGTMQSYGHKCICVWISRRQARLHTSG